MLIALSLLVLVPIIAYRIVYRTQPSYLWSVTGFSFGLVAAPISLGLYAMFFIPVVGFVPGMIGFLLALFHGTPGFNIATILGIRDSGKVVEGNEHLVIGMINALVWGLIYGGIGFCIDRYRKRQYP